MLCTRTILYCYCHEVCVLQLTGQTLKVTWDAMLCMTHHRMLRMEFHLLPHFRFLSLRQIHSIHEYFSSSQTLEPSGFMRIVFCNCVHWWVPVCRLLQRNDVCCLLLKILLYTVSGKKKRPQYSRHNFDKFRDSFVIFGTSRPDTLAY